MASIQGMWEGEWPQYRACGRGSGLNTGHVGGVASIQGMWEGSGLNIGHVGGGGVASIQGMWEEGEWPKYSCQVTSTETSCTGLELSCLILVSFP